ncbi:hypothetical protein GALL_107670 [mine drainage metagenome]|uniref:MSHA pilin protein MshD n=1 Tax=mine drainage metagenome TaxID=410659 RepID=A0A1J5SFR0_9ZZZZ
MCIERGAECRLRQSGMTLIELVMFIVIVSVGVVGILTVLNITAKNSADPLIRKQMLAIAAGLIEEVELQPFTYCDPTDANVATATSPAGCASTVENLGPEAGETRTGAAPFNNVNDYNGLSLPSPITDITGGNPAPAGYSASIAVVPEALNGIASSSTPANMNVLRIAVTVTHGSDSLTLEGYRTRHSPNFAP